MPAGRQGISFRAIVEEGDIQNPHQPYVVSETYFFQTGGTRGWSVRTPQYKYVLYESGKNREMLYDMQTDRGEMCNLAIESKYRDILLQHRQKLSEWMKKHPLPGRISALQFIPKDFE